MWAGSRISFRGDLRIGRDIVRRSTIAGIKRKEGASGTLVFVTVRHEIAEADGRNLVVEDQDIVYRGISGAAVKQAPAAAERGDWHRSLAPDAVMLFRYSALTFNGHRIHYDRDYATGEESYPGLVVHGPLIATLLLDLLRRKTLSRRVESFSFRAVSPLFDGSEMSVNATPPEADGAVKLWAANHEGDLAMTAEAMLT